MFLTCSAVSRSAVSDCGISWSYSLTFWSFLVNYNHNRSALLCKLLTDKIVCQRKQTVNYLTIIIAIADLF